ncbi:MAG: hypothetical protein K8S55_16180 [Phycisphaerae bacterium]|nr:hypothetical protein [Phycisphaerae bacterium]
MSRLFKSTLTLIGGKIGADILPDDPWKVIRKKYVNWGRRHPHWLAVPSAGAYLLLPNKCVLAILAPSFLSSIISVSSILAGFLTMGISVLLALGGKRIMRLLDELNLRKEVYRSVWCATKWMLLMAACAMIALFVTTIETPKNQMTPDCTWWCRASAFVVFFVGMCSLFHGWTALKNITAVVNRHIEMDAKEN